MKANSATHTHTHPPTHLPNLPLPPPPPNSNKSASVTKRGSSVTLRSGFLLFLKKIVKRINYLVSPDGAVQDFALLGSELCEVGRGFHA